MIFLLTLDDLCVVEMRRLVNNACPTAIILIVAMIFSSIGLAQEAPTISTDKSIYKIGETVQFILTGLEPNQTYMIEILRGEASVTTITFTTDEGGLPTSDASWNTGEAGTGTYKYVLRSNGNELGYGGFGIVGINKEEFSADEEIVVSGGGAVPGATVSAALMNDSSSLATASTAANDAGEFSLSLAIPYDTPNGTYRVVVDVSGVVITFEVRVETTASELLGSTDLMFEELLTNVSGINASIVNSLLSKLMNARDKVEAAEELLADGKIHVARNMLKATRNKLKAFIHEVMAQRGKHIDEATADSLIQAAERLIERINYLLSLIDPQADVHATDASGKIKDKNSGDKDERGNKHGKDKDDRGDKGKKGKKWSES